MTEEDWKFAKTNCVSCGEGLIKKDFPQFGNYCKKCCALSKAMSDRRKGTEQEIEKKMRELFYSHGREDLVGKESIMADLKLLFVQ
jgi:hypothetical protein